MPSRDQPAGPSRALGPTATFGDLVDAARALDEAGRADSAAGCLLSGGNAVGAGWRLEADLAISVRPLPEATPNLAARIGPGSLRVLDRWGQHGEGPYDLALAVFTAAPPPGHGRTLVLLLTPEGVYARDTGAASRRAEPVAVDALSTRLADEADEHGLWVVTAGADTPLGRVRRVLAAVPPQAPPVALATPLPEGTRLPEPPDREAAPADDTELCPDGLPPPPADEPAGDLEPSTVIAALEPVQQAARQCMQASATSGGRLEVDFRVGPSGEVQQACARTDAAGDPILRACLLDAVRRLELPEPEPSGVIDLSLPFVLEPDRGAAPRPLCD